MLRFIRGGHHRPPRTDAGAADDRGAMRAASVRMLHVVQAADGGAAPSPVALVRSDDGQWEGVLAGDTVVLFPQSAAPALPVALRYSAPAGAAVHVITGLTPGAGYDVQMERTDHGTVVSIQPGAALRADEGGVLVIR